MLLVLFTRFDIHQQSVFCFLLVCLSSTPTFLSLPCPFGLLAMPTPAASSSDVKSSSDIGKPVGAAALTKPNSPAKDAAAATADIDAAVLTSDPSTNPKLRSAPVPTTVKTGSNPAPAPIPTTTVIDLEGDWCDNSPLDHCSHMKDIVMRIPSPPSEMEHVTPASPGTSGSVAPILTRTTPPQGLPIGSLRPEWLRCASPITTITPEYLQLENVRHRVDIRVLRETERCPVESESDTKWCEGAASRFHEVHKGRYYIPANIQCDRTTIEQPSDAVYVERMWVYLFNDSESLPPICTDAKLYEVTVSADKTKIQQHQLSWAIALLRGRVVTFEDFFVARRSIVDLSKATVTEGSDDPSLCVPWDLFPSVPKWLAEAVDLRSAHMSPIRALTYFAQTARQGGKKVYQRWNRSLQVELAIHTAVAHYTAWARPVIDQPRIWYPTPEHVKWLKRFVNLPTIPVFYEALGKYIAVNVRDVVRILEDTLARTVPIARKDYRTKTMVPFVATPNSQVFVDNPLREAHLKPSTAVPSVPTSSVPVAVQATPKTTGTGVLTVKGVMSGRILKRDSLKKNTRMTVDMVSGLRGNGPWSAGEIIDHIAAHSGGLLAKNQCLTSELTGLRQEVQRLREDMSRYRDDANRLSGELRQLRESHSASAYGEGNRGYGSRGYYDPYERRY